jgi:hypothetical protein
MKENQANLLYFSDEDNHLKVKSLFLKAIQKKLILKDLEFYELSQIKGGFCFGLIF